MVFVVREHRLGELHGGAHDRKPARAKAGDRVRRPLAWFGAAELVIGATALASPAILRTLERVRRRL